ncbi:MAG: MerR family DNA-binding transcriptional regulator [Gammaproteobacteria bacterium]|nr:MerR family DNA-binding transcriptional regulator [Gammaproteobacteria bacterium]
MNDAVDRLFTAPEFAEAFGVTARALRFYETKGLLSPRRMGARRVYDHRDRARLQLILRGKRLGFSLAEIAGYLELYQADTAQVEQLKRLESMVDQRVEALEQQRGALETTLDELGEIRLQVTDALKQRGVTLAPPPPEAERHVLPKIRAKYANDRGTTADGSQGDN